MRAAILATAVVALLAAPPAKAHEGGVDAKGTVQVVTPERITIETAQGEKSFELTPGTSFARAGSPARREDLRVGERVVVHARERNGGLEAIQVRAGQAKGATPTR